MDDRCLLAAAGCVDLAGRRARRSLRPAPLVSHRTRDLYPGLGGMRGGAFSCVAAGRPQSPRTGSGAADAQQSGHSRRRIHRRGSGPRNRHLGRGRRAGRRDRARARRMDRGHGRMARDFSSQFADCRGRRLSVLALSRRAQGMAVRRAAGCRRRRPCDGRAGLAHLVVDQGVGVRRRTGVAVGRSFRRKHSSGRIPGGSRADSKTGRSCP